MTKRGVSPHQLRTVALVGHRSSGKTSLGSLLLHAARVTRTIGRVQDGTSLLDHTPASRKRKLTLEPSFAWLPWQDREIQLADTPGASGLAHVSNAVMGQVDAALLVIDHPAGIQQGTRQSLASADQYNLAVVAVLNKLEDRDGPSIAERLTELAAASGRVPVLLQQPFWNENGRLIGVINLFSNRVIRYDNQRQGRFSAEPVPTRLAPAVAATRERAIEALALTQDDLLEHYLEYLSMPDDLFFDALAQGVRAGRVIPVVLASADLGIGAQPLLDLLVRVAPSPLERSPVVGRNSDGASVPVDPQGPLVATVVAASLDANGQPYQVLRVWGGALRPGIALHHGGSGVVAKVRKWFQIRGPRRATAHTLGAGALVATWDAIQARPGDTLTGGPKLALRRVSLRPLMSRRLIRSPVANLPEALAQLQRLDHGIEVATCEVTGGCLLRGCSAMQIARAVDWLSALVGVPVQALPPPIDYRQAPTAQATHVTGTHIKRASGLVAEYAQVTIDIKPEPQSMGVVAIDARTEVHFPSQFVPAVQQGLAKAARRGPLGAFPVTGALVTVVGGQYNMLVSTPEHFELAAEQALQAALSVSSTHLMEPWCELVVTAPGDYVGAVLSDLSSHHAVVQSLEVDDQASYIKVRCPVRATQDLEARLDGLTHGQGWFTLKTTHYAPLPKALVPSVLANASS